MTMIHIIDKYYYEIGDNQYILYECGQREKIDIKTKKGTGEMKEYQDCLGYFTSLESMLNKLIKAWGNDKSRKNNVSTISEHIRILSDIRKDVLEATKSF